MDSNTSRNSWVSDSFLTGEKRSMSSNDLFTIQYSLRPSLIDSSNSCYYIPSFDENHLTKNAFRHSTGLPNIYEGFDGNDLKPKSTLTQSASLLSSFSDSTECSPEKATKINLNNKTKKPIRFSLRRVFSWKKLDKESSDMEITLSDIQNIHLANHLQCKLYHKWNKMWCVVAEGNFYCFKSNKQNEKIQFFLHLADSQFKYSSLSLNGRTDSQKTFLIEISSQNKFILLNASSSSDQVCWINALTKEKVSALKTSDPQRIPCCGNNVCSLCSHFSCSDVHISVTPSTELSDIPASPEKSDYHSISSFNDEKDHGYTTASDDYDNQSSVGSQNGIGESYTPPSLRVLAQEVALKLPESDTFSFEDNFSKTILERNNNNWNTDSQMMAHISRTKIIPPTLTPAKKSLCNAQQSCSLSPDETKSSVHTTKLLTTEGGVQTAKRPKSLPIVENLFNDTTKCKIDKLSSSVSSLHLQPQTVMSGYLERRTSLEEWSKFWFVLKGNVLYCYPKYETQSTSIDCIDLNGSHIVTTSDPLPGRQFMFQITTKDGSCSEYCASTEDSLTNWMNHLLTATESCSTSSPSIGSEGFFSSREDLTACDPAHTCEEFKDKTKLLKQQLLSNVVQQINDIKHRQELRQSAELENEACDKESMCMTRLVQRRMSAQLTLQSLQKQINSHSKKSIFGFGGGNKKKGNLNQKDHLANQVEELNNELEQIDRSLHRHCNDHPEMAIQSNAHLLSPDSQTKQSSGIKHISSISKSFHISSKSRLGLIRPVKLRNSRLTKENRFSTPPVLINSWGTESPNVNSNSNQTSPNSSENMFLKSLDLADNATKTLSHCSQSDPKRNSHHSYTTDQIEHLSNLKTNSSHKKSDLKISSDAMSEIEAFEELSKKYFTKQMMPPSSNA
ncbi:Hypothetical predicted protein [Octopus vulgaris]|uniref:PH domain-containing protein n=1 Tax=Octopus vulgaris TaxID=6645 RepID=A0AA36F3N6_OCTVU|nr:Hypothetical predicted protein [Octopus vulgaris]